MFRPAWTPVLADGARRHALELVAGIAADLEAGYPAATGEPTEWTLGFGRAGAALFFAYLGQALGDTDAASPTAVRLLGEALETAAAQPLTASLYEGFIGVAWTLAHLDGWVLDLSDADPNQAVDGALLELLTTSPWTAEYDLIGGLVGIGVYALERLPRPIARECLNLVVARLDELARPAEGGLSWWTPASGLPASVARQFPSGAFNLGVAHGVPGVIAMLGKVCRTDTSSLAARRLLDAAVRWLMAQRLDEAPGASFPTHVAPGVRPSPGRSAWCYGDPGVASALLLAARQAGEPDWEARALTIAELAAARPSADCGVRDAGVCHGAAGLAHLFNRLYQITGRPVFREAVERWVECLFATPPVGNGAGGLLEGSVGVGLVLLALATPLDPRWDRILLLS